MKKKKYGEVNRCALRKTCYQWRYRYLDRLAAYPARCCALGLYSTLVCDHGRLDTRLLREPESGGAATGLEDNILALKKYVAKNGKANAVVSLDTTEASTVTDRSVVDELPVDNLLDATNGNS